MNDHRPTRTDHFRKGATQGPKRTRTLARILDAAAALFAERGVAATSVLQITREAKVANGTFYSYFKDKDEMVEVVYKSITNALVNDILVRVDELDSGPEQIVLGSIWFIEAVAAEPYWASMIITALETRTELRTLCENAITRYIANGSNQGLFHMPPDFGPGHGLVDFMIAILIGAIRSYASRSGTSLSDLSRLAAEMHLRMLGMPFEAARTIAMKVQEDFGRPPAMRMPSVKPSPSRH